MSRRTHETRTRLREGFTLVELMISLALVLLLTLAITQIFRVTTTTIGKGNATGEVVRGLEAVRTALQTDFTGSDQIGYDALADEGGILPLAQQPALIISSRTYGAFLNETDFRGDRDWQQTATNPPTNPGRDTIDTDNDGVDDLALTNYRIGQRWFRGDRLSFFASGEFRSQANSIPGNGNFFGNVTSTEAWVWYGHARVYNGGGDINATTQYKSIGEGEPLSGSTSYNPNNYYANDWTLVRSVILLKEPVDHDGVLNTEKTVVDSTGAPVLHYNIITRTTGSTPWSLDDPRNPNTLAYNGGTNSLANVAPLRYGNNAHYFNSTTGENDVFRYVPTNRIYLIQDSRVDVAGLTTSAFREHLDAIQRGPVEFNRIYYPMPRRTWYDQLFASEVSTDQRFWINPLVLKPLDAGEVSQATTYLLGGATQFIVEFAGDFYTQDPTTGAVTARGADAVVDFTIDAGGVRHIRWYGLPRDVDGLITTGGVTYFIPGPGAPPAILQQSLDVRPVADYATPNVAYPFEKRLPGQLSGGAPAQRDTIVDYGVGIARFTANASPSDDAYLCAWGPADFDGGFNAAPYDLPMGPKLIRVIVESIDKRDRLENPIAMELVFRVPAE